MKPVIDWIFKVVIFLTVGQLATWSLFLLALLHWDRRYMDAAWVVVAAGLEGVILRKKE